MRHQREYQMPDGSTVVVCESDFHYLELTLATPGLIDQWVTMGRYVETGQGVIDRKQAGR